MAPMSRNRDHLHLARLRDVFARNGAIPSYAGLCSELRFRSKTAAVKLAHRLISRGFLQRTPGGRLAPGEHFFDLVITDTPVRAGVPDIAEPEQAAMAWSADRWLQDRRQPQFAVTVKGDSMRDAGILDGDVVLVSKTGSPGPGDLVVANVDGEFTLKEFRLEDGAPVLLPHNPAFAPIRPTQALDIVGVATGLARRIPSHASPSTRLKTKAVRRTPK